MEKYICPFKISDLVTHKTNSSVVLFVYWIDNSNMKDEEFPGIVCKWIDFKGNYHRESFAPIELQKSIAI